MPSVTATVRNKASRQASAPVTVSYQVRSLLVGIDAPTGTEWTSALATWQNPRYTREFGTDGSDTDALPELPSMSAQKITTLPAGASLHVSWKDDVEQLSTWLNGLTRPTYLTWYHEPMGNVAPATYRATATRMTQIINGHAKRHLVLGHGPIVTRYWLDDGGGSPTDWGYPGMTFYGIDCYMNAPAATSYYSTAKMFDVPFSKVRAAYPGIRLLVPEYGLARISTDKTGAGRAAAMRNHIAYLRTLSYVDAVAYFNSSAFPNYQIASASPEGQAWRDMQAA